ncbi:NmrA family NAD(P)-binding protein [Kutzneria sp. CA-103260]|uniref:NmrA family NAD(P)-binding protein n=1 Tax=Kutzneria sp. CA-103260 TaxID=2802641 RepID=UPI001BACC7CB|nr:NAD(P)H-binding protein [Kutzneria sp. CA-103260]QUQ66951.1 NmrA family transcriptional regulator [Kutzneria sp. CA-103260]
MIVVTTPTGAIGSKVVRNLLDRDAKVRVIVRDPAKLSDSVRDRVEVVPGSHSDADVVNTAFVGADAVFWLAPPNFRAVSLDAAYSDFARPAAAAFVSQGVGRVVGVSALGRGTLVAGQAGFVTGALAMDDVIAASGVNFRSLALPGFMDNVLRQVDEIMNEGVYRTPLRADLKLPHCATQDIAAAATRLLLDDTWTGQGHVAVLGPEDLSSNDMAAIMSDVLGRPVRCEQTPPEAFLAGLQASGMSEATVRAYFDMMTAKNNGLDEAEPRTPESSSPTSFRQWCEEVLKPAAAAR